MPKDKMKPCPFCGGEAELVKSIRPWIRCKQCYAQRHILVWTHMIDEIEAVIKAWNTRPTPASEGSITDWEKEFDDYWHIGQAQILSGKISKVDFKRNIKAFIRKLLEEERKKLTRKVARRHVSQIKAQCAEELDNLPINVPDEYCDFEDLQKLLIDIATQVENLIKKWRAK